MKRNSRVWAGWLLGCLCCQCHAAGIDEGVRDPFWPIGYAPSQPQVEAGADEAVPLIKIKQPPPKPRTITAEDWQNARATLKVSGVTRTTVAQDAIRAHALIDNRLYQEGDTLCITNQNIRFSWQIGNLDKLKLELIAQEALDLKFHEENQNDKQTDIQE